MPFKSPCNFKLKQNELHRGRVHQRLANDFINGNGCQAQQVPDGSAFFICWLGIFGFRLKEGLC